MKNSLCWRIAVVCVVAVALSVWAGGAYAQEGHGDKPHWGYDGEVGPEHWGELNEEYALCATGTTQSPVDISAVTVPDTGSLAIQYEPTPLNIVNNGHAIQVDYGEGSFIELDGTVYNLVQFHFHQGSENTLNGEQAPMEMHLVHKSADGELAVIGVMLAIGGEDNAAYQTFWDHLPTIATERRTIDTIEVNAADLLPENLSYYRFMGSLTTPPCTEGVNWVVMAEPVMISQAQYDAFGAVYDHNFRPVQPLNDRVITVNE